MYVQCDFPGKSRKCHATLELLVSVDVCAYWCIIVCVCICVHTCMCVYLDVFPGKSRSAPLELLVIVDVCAHWCIIVYICVFVYTHVCVCLSRYIFPANREGAHQVFHCS